MSKLQRTAARGKLLSLAALAIIVLGFSAPAHAMDKILVDLDTTAATLQRSGNLYKHNSSVRVRNSNTYGFTLSMNASQPNLVNSKDSSYKIDSVSGTNRQLNANQWGYGMGKDATTFSSVSSATLADVTSDSKGGCTEVDDCTLYFTLGANINSKKLPTGQYSTSLTYTVTSKPAPYVPPAPDPEPYVPSTPPEPYIPPKPKWTTNGCYYDDGNFRNCISFLNPTYPNTQKVVWRGDAWYVIRIDENRGWFDYGNSYSTWAHAAILTKSGKQKIDHLLYGSRMSEVKLDLDDIVKIFAYVPAYSRQGNYINFCGSINTTIHACEYSDVGSSFNMWVEAINSGSGFWVGMRAMGCTNVPDESKCDYRYECYQGDALDRRYSSHEYSSDAKKVADTLAEALGSPCY